MRTIIRGGRVLDPASSTDGIRDILVEDGIIKEVAEHISTDAENVIEAEGLYVMPGLIDLHVHFGSRDLNIRKQSVPEPEQRREADLQPFVSCRIPSRS